MTEKLMNDTGTERALHLLARRRRYIEEFIASGGSDTDVIGFAEFLAEKQSKDWRCRQASALPGA